MVAERFCHPPPTTGAGATPSGFGSPASRGKRVSTVVAKGRHLPASARLAEVLTKHDEHVAYYGHLMEREIKAEAQEARHLIDTEVFSPTVEKHTKRSALPKLPLGCDMDAAVRKDVADIDPLLDEIVGPVPDVAAEINQADLKPLANIVAVVHKFGHTPVGKVLIALLCQPPATTAPPPQYPPDEQPL